MAPEVSIACSTYQRAKRLPAFFAALNALEFPRDRFEVVIVNNGSTDDTARVLKQLAADSPLDVRVVTLDKNRGAGGGRNAAWRGARGSVVAFTDDDCAPHPAWLGEGTAVLSDPEVAIVVGRTEPNPEQEGNRRAFSRTQSVTAVNGTRYMPTCNVFYRRQDLEAVGGFDERFETKGGEDTDLGWRVLDRGGAVVFAEAAVVLHDISVGSFRAALREAATWRDIPLVAARHPRRMRPLLVHRLFWKKTHELVLLAVGGITLASAMRSPVPLLAAVPWINFRLRKWPMVRERGVRRVLYLPHALAIDIVEVTTMARGSVRNRTFVL